MIDPDREERPFLKSAEASDHRSLRVQQIRPWWRLLDSQVFGNGTVDREGTQADYWNYQTFIGLGYIDYKSGKRHCSESTFVDQGERKMEERAN